MNGVCASAAAATSPVSDWDVVLGAGSERVPSWSGAPQHKHSWVPYFDITWRDRVELSSTDGLSVDLLHDTRWHGGLIGSVEWGRSNRDLHALAGKVRTLSNTEQGGLYVEYAFREGVDAGASLRRDLQGTGSAYGRLYGDIGLPAAWGIEHQLRVSFDFMNRSAMQRFYGLAATEADALSTAPYTPAGGLSRNAIAYQAYLPVTPASGLVVAAEFARLRGNAARSPLIRQLGRATQSSLLLSYVVHF